MHPKVKPWYPASLHLLCRLGWRYYKDANSYLHSWRLLNKVLVVEIRYTIHLRFKWFPCWLIFKENFIHSKQQILDYDLRTDKREHMRVGWKTFGCSTIGFLSFSTNENVRWIGDKDFTSSLWASTIETSATLCPIVIRCKYVHNHTQIRVSLHSSKKKLQSH